MGYLHLTPEIIHPEDIRIRIKVFRNEAVNGVTYANVFETTGVVP